MNFFRRFIVGQDETDFTVMVEGGGGWTVIARCPSREYAREIAIALRESRDKNEQL